MCREVARFIAAGRIDAVIDQVGQSVITMVTVEDTRQGELREFLRAADGVLNRLQKLNRLVSA